MKRIQEFECEERKKRKVLNVLELSDGNLVYIRLDDGKRYLLNGDGCWRCGSTASCFGNMMGDNELEVVCEFGFFDEVRSLFLCLLQDRMAKTKNWLFEKVNEKACTLTERLVDTFIKVVEYMNVKER